MTVSVQSSGLAAEWHVVARIDDIHGDRPFHARLLGTNLVLWRSGDRIQAWHDRCPHRGVPLSNGWVEQSSQLVCPYHGMAFNSEGQCVSIPAHPHLTQLPKAAAAQTCWVKQQYGYVWVALSQPTQPPPQLDEWMNQQGQSPFYYFHCGPYSIRTSAPRVVENFLDVAHFPFVHGGSLGDRQFPEVSDYRLSVDEQGIITAHDIRAYQPDPDGTGEAKSVSYTYQVLRPLIAYFRKGTADLQLSIFLTVTPIDELHSLAWMGVARNYAPDAAVDELRAFQDHLMAQDIPMVESQQPQRLPLQLEAEFHFPCDQLAIAYRKRLKQLNIRFGTC